MSTRLIATPFFLATLLESVLAFPTGSALAAENYCESALSINEFSSWQFNYQFDAAKIQKFFDQTESSLSVTDLNTGRTEVIANQADPLADSYFRSPDCRWIVIASQDVIYDLKNRTFKPFAFIDSAPLVTFPHNQATTAYLTYSEKDKISVVRLDLDTGMTRLQFQTSSSNPELISFDLVDDGVVVELPYYLPVAFSRENMKLAFSGTSRIDYFSINPEAQPSTLGSAYEMPRRRNSSRPRRNSRIVLRGTGDVSTFEMNLKSVVRRQVVGFPNKFEREAVSPLYYPLNEVISAIFYESHSDSLCAAFNNSLFVEDPKSFVVTEKKLESSTEFLIDPTVGLFSSSREAGQTRPRYFSSETNLLLFESAVDYPSAYSESNGLLDLSTANPRDYFLTKSVRGQSNRGAELFELYFNHGLSSSRPFVFDQADNKNSKR
ncbi:MAG: hypothetical protein NTV34_12675, partial [Proteobacteria bacterium]|nr:hypothetical protein [Pseudomonadota bacterium]